MDIDVEAPHSLVGAEFSGSMAPVKETVQEVLISPVKEPLKDGALFIDERLKFEKLEQMIGEKNKEIESLKKDLEAERTTRGEFETLRKTFQEQIEELKLQNRRSKADLQAAVQENVELKKSFVKEQKSVVEEYIRAEVDTAPDIILDAPMENRAEVPLKDIFNQNNIKKEGNV
jgi:septal ring factor EnvC (AmiA/AmiB activator)